MLAHLQPKEAASSVSRVCEETSKLETSQPAGGQVTQEKLKKVKVRAGNGMMARGRERSRGRRRGKDGKGKGGMGTVNVRQRLTISVVGWTTCLLCLLLTTSSSLL